MKDLKKDLRQMSLTPCISNIAENFVFCDYVTPVVLQALDSNQFGAVSEVLYHTWTEVTITDGNGFDLNDHSILVSK